MSEGIVLDCAALLERSFEVAAERGGDITPLVFARFFEIAPKAEALFQLDTLDPQARGRMLAEMLTMLVDQARGEGYVGPTLATIAADHVAYGVEDFSLYEAWLDALTDVVRDLNAAGWTPEIAAAWQRQRGQFLSALARKRHQ
ncbi:globin [Novosphingobium sp. CECT 9465]|uniref:globin n=1 Tax=Novosphingobium sp. CECT 9465 TaxID=2829794 RepID=UPI001E5403CB|nr:globin [Novosphingobium sp. CECT 9465]CAH0495427.1 hypothetical protein NVSP9465_00433 [Novosphingobium sp. CECT 9465]